MSEKIVTVEDTPSIKGVHAFAAALHFKYMTPQQRAEEDLNDKKASWLYVVSMKPKNALTEREKMFIDRYTKDGIKWSLYWYYKPEIVQFIEEQKIKLLGEK